MIISTSFIRTLERTRLDNPLRRKFAAKRAAAQGMQSVQLFFTPLFLRSRVSGPISRWCGTFTRSQTSDCPDARRVPAAQQDSFPPKSSRERYKRSTYSIILTV